MASVTVRASLFLALLAGLSVCSLSAESSSGDAEEDGTKASVDGFTDDQLGQAHVDWDANNDNKVSRQELLTFVDKHKSNVMLDNTLDPEFARQDTSNDGLVSLEEHLVAESAPAGEAECSGKTGLSEEEYIQCVKAAIEVRQKYATELFTAADANGDGMLEKSEMSAVLSPATHDQTLNVVVKKQFGGADTNKDGKVSLQEFQDEDMAVHAAITIEQRRDKPDAGKLFQQLDTNGDGSLDQNELRDLASGQIQRERIVDNVVDSLDTDGDKHIEVKELLAGKDSQDVHDIDDSEDVVHESELQDYLIAWAKRRQTLAGAR